MNKFTLLPLFLLLFFSAKAQDVIISIKKDTIHCKIVSISNKRILYEVINNERSITGMSIPLSQVEEYSRSHQLENETRMARRKRPKPENPLFWELKLGGSVMPWYLDNFQSSSFLPDYYQQLKTGIHINASANYMLNGILGLGVAYSFFRSGTSGRIPGEYYPSMFLIESEKYQLFTNYLGASVIFQQHLDVQRKFVIRESLSAGVMFVRMEYQNTYPSVTQMAYTDISNNMLLTGNSFSGKLGFAVEYKLLANVSVGLGGDFIWGLLKKASLESKGTNTNYYSINDQELSNPMKLSRIDYSFVLRYNF